MKRILTLILFLIAHASHASLTSCYTYDSTHSKTTVNGDWVWTGNGKGTTTLYKLNHGRVEAALCYAPAGQSFIEASIWRALSLTSDRNQAWVEYSHINGSRDFVTADKRIWAKLYWYNGQHILRICYKQFLTANGWWPHDNKMPSRPTAKAKPNKPEPGAHFASTGRRSGSQLMKPLTKATIPYSEVVAMADMLLAKPPEFFEPFLGHVPTFDEITKFVDAQVKERMTDGVWVNDIYQVAVRPADKWGEEHGWPSCIQY